MTPPIIQVEGLTKSYGTTRAISDLTFTVERGEVVGFLGPNGAGKSTTMRILAGAQGATSGRALIDGIDVFDDPKQVKMRIGYQPEVPPVYTDMTVRDFLIFCARIKRCAQPREDAERAIGKVGLNSVAHRLIAHLSKGYRQRVGIAQALVHRPKLLILDEPTSGLDPAQRVEIRNLVRELAAGETTVILSTHVLSEVEATCERVIIVNHGRIVAESSLEAMRAANHTVKLRVARPTAETLAAFAALGPVDQVTEEAAGSYTITATEDVREQVAAAAVAFGLLELGAANGLEQVFLSLTGDAS